MLNRRRLDRLVEELKPERTHINCVSLSSEDGSIRSIHYSDGTRKEPSEIPAEELASIKRRIKGDDEGSSDRPFKVYIGFSPDDL